MATMSTSDLVRLDEHLWEIPAEARADMRVPARIFADRELLDAIVGDESLEQLQDVATLPEIVEAALASALVGPLSLGRAAARSPPR